MLEEEEENYSNIEVKKTSIIEETTRGSASSSITNASTISNENLGSITT